MPFHSCNRNALIVVKIGNIFVPTVQILVQDNKYLYIKYITAQTGPATIVLCSILQANTIIPYSNRPCLQLPLNIP